MVPNNTAIASMLLRHSNPTFVLIKFPPVYAMLAADESDTIPPEFCIE
jgi:hypothetical protein